MSLTLTKLSETTATLTLGWPPPVGIGGYVFYANGVAVSTGSPNLKNGTPRDSVKFSKTTPGPPFQVAAVCRQSGILLLDVGTYAEASPPPPPAPTFQTNIADGQTLAMPFTWTADVTPTPERVEFWAEGVKVEDSVVPFSTILDLQPGEYDLDICAWIGGVRTCYGQGRLATITVAGTPPPPPPPPPPPSGSILWRGDFETGDFSQWGSPQQKVVGRASIVQSPVRQGRYAARCEVRSGDNNVAGSGSGERCEWMSGQATQADEGVEEWWAWSTYFDPSFSPSSSGWNYWTQFHNSGASGQANIGFFTQQAGNLGLRVCSGADPANPTMRYHSLGTRQNGRWYDIVFHIKWSRSDSVGYVEVWVNGQQLVPRSMGANLYPNQRAYLKQGYYRAATNNTAIIYHDGMRRGTSYEAVAAEFA